MYSSIHIKKSFNLCLTWGKLCFQTLFAQLFHKFYSWTQNASYFMSKKILSVWFSVSLLNIGKSLANNNNNQNESIKYIFSYSRMNVKLSFQCMAGYQKVNLSQSVSENTSLAECRPPFYIAVHNLVGAAI